MRHFVQLGLFLLAASCVGCTTATQPLPLGKWAGDPEAARAGLADAEARYGKKQMENLVRKDFIAIVGDLTAEFRPDGTCELACRGNTLRGTWTLDNSENLLELHIVKAESQLPDGETVPRFLQAQQFFGIPNAKQQTIDLFAGDRQAYETVKHVYAIQPVRPLLVLKRK